MSNLFRIFYLMVITTIVFLLSGPSYALVIPCTMIDAGLPNTATVPGISETWIEATFDGIYVDVDDYSRRYGLITTKGVMKQSKAVLEGLKKSPSDRAILASVSYHVVATCSGGKNAELVPGDKFGCGENESMLIELNQPFCKTTSGGDRRGVFTVTRHTKSSLVDDGIKVTVPMPLDVSVKDKLLDLKSGALFTGVAGGVSGSDGKVL